MGTLFIGKKHKFQHRIFFITIYSEFKRKKSALIVINKKFKRNNFARCLNTIIYQ
jgi:hypothetical protein